MAEFNENVWAPWRMQYIRSLEQEQKDDGCFMCQYWNEPAADEENHVIWRGRTAFVVMNRFPYTNGHLLVIHARHKGDLFELADDELNEMMRLTRDALGILRKTVRPQGVNIGYNLGQCAGAGLPGHLHAHIVPRWSGDTNFMPVLGDVRVVPDALDTLYAELVRIARETGFRS
jgi:ATP adenylyltransferase